MKRTKSNRTKYDGSVQEIRRNKLRAERERLGSAYKLAEKSGMSSAEYYNQLITGNSPVTDRFAERFEKAMHHRKGWLSTPEDEEEEVTATAPEAPESDRPDANGGDGVITDRALDLLDATMEAVDQLKDDLKPRAARRIALVVWLKSANSGKVDRSLIRELVSVAQSNV